MSFFLHLLVYQVLLNLPLSASFVLTFFPPSSYSCSYDCELLNILAILSILPSSSISLSLHPEICHLLPYVLLFAFLSFQYTFFSCSYNCSPFDIFSILSLLHPMSMSLFLHLLHPHALILYPLSSSVSSCSFHILIFQHLLYPFISIFFPSSFLH